jgi:murein DD-endopeptidase MepM/ murein hydrolase activator NlpD
MKALPAFGLGLSIGLTLLAMNAYRSDNSMSALSDNHTIKVLQIQEKAEIDRLYADASLASVVSSNNQLIEDFLKLTTNYKLLTTFANAGHIPENIKQVQELASEFDKIPFGSPFGENAYTVTSNYGQGKPTWYRQSGNHLGIDIVPQSGYGQVVATADGQIIDWGVSDTIGKWVLFETDTGYRIKYAHLRTIYWQNTDEEVSFVPIRKGGKIAVYGNTGTLSTGRHLHMEIMNENPKGVFTHLNPEQILLYIGSTKENKL